MTIQPKFRVTDDEAAQLQKAARAAGLTISAFAKMAALQIAGTYNPVAVGSEPRRSRKTPAPTPSPSPPRRTAVRVCPEPGCIWRTFNLPDAVCPNHGKGMDQ